VTIEDQLALQRLLAEYCRRIDDADFPGAAGLFTEDGSFSFGAETAVGRTALADWFEANQPPHRRGTHIGSGPIVDLVGDRAEVTSDFVFVRFIKGVLAVEVAGRYLDRCVRTDDGWLIEQRVCDVLEPPVR
jgi:hypothetical protein